MSLDRIWLVTAPRTASNLFVRILAPDQQPNTISGEYYFRDALWQTERSRCLEKSQEAWSADDISGLRKAYQCCFDRLQSFSSTATEKRIILKEHALFVLDPGVRARSHNSVLKEEHLCCRVQDRVTGDLQLPGLPLNISVLPDRFLAGWFPVFLIRHPAIVFPSYYRTYVTHWARSPEVLERCKGEIKTAMTLRWSRYLYDWYQAIWEQTGRHKNLPAPIVLDAEDIMSEPQLVARFCQTVGLDSSQLQYSWEPVSKDVLESINPGKRRMRDTLYASSGVDQGRIKREIDMDEEIQKWKTEFGGAAALDLEHWVRVAMPDYEFMHQRRFT
ncbi:hypothetical protein BDV29DRAFT_190841 [Aspergillus leporis]|uniref:P-loop containing nucleoside triphosphate hydrolase protein n=1 Tax=Aspergillus leporis TaxID=41062 RepID=A0A5N5X1C5_9EURO|nr:hypothetical protein BDV29DRAFT_190841 [Aspergillus leporis]